VAASSRAYTLRGSNKKPLSWRTTADREWYD